MITRIDVRCEGLTWNLTPEEFEKSNLDFRKISDITVHETVTLEELQARLDMYNGFSWRIYDKQMPGRRTGFMPYKSEREALAFLQNLQQSCCADDYGVRKEKD
jgi:hypothetical protein